MRNGAEELYERKSMTLSDNAIKVLDRRIARRKKDGTLEKPEEIFRRVASFIAGGPATYGHEWEWEGKFYDAMINQEFLPNSPCLVNAGTEGGQLSACFVLPVEDSMEGIYSTLKDMAIIHKTGGGTGFNFSKLRPANSPVDSTIGIASGPVSFMKVYDASTEAVKQGGVRRGANMGILNISHPDIFSFIEAKQDGITLQNFNISVAMTDEFMEHVEAKRWAEPWALYHTGQEYEATDVGSIWDFIVYNAWLTGDPGLIFIDRMNEKGTNPMPELGPIEATNPCGEQGLYPYDSCNLGSINLGKFVIDSYGVPSINYKKLGTIIEMSIRFLNNVIDLNVYPLPQIDEMSKKTRRIGLGVMGWADMLAQLGIEYDSEESIQLAEYLSKWITSTALVVSTGLELKNSALTTVAPTGTISIIADCSYGIEPYFNLDFTSSHYLDDTDYTRRTELIRKSKYTGKVAHEISPEMHVRMQAAWQSGIDNAVSKTINLPNSATIKDVETIYLLAWQMKCKGITMYRDGSKENQVLFTEDSYDGVLHRSDDRIIPSVLVGQQERQLKLPMDRPSTTHRFVVGGQKGYITIGEINNNPVEVFINVSKRGSTVNGLIDVIAKLTSICLQHNVPVQTIVTQLKGDRFEPAGLTSNPNIPTATSLTDYLGKLLEYKFLTTAEEKLEDLSPYDVEIKTAPTGGLCLDCGGSMRYDGRCEFCPDCGYSHC